MAAFYARYVPQSRPVHTRATYDRPFSKRKQEDDREDFESNGKRPKTETGKRGHKLAQKQSQTSSEEPRRGNPGIPQSSQQKVSTRLKEARLWVSESEGKEVLAKCSSVKDSEKANGTDVSRLGNEDGHARSLGFDPRPADTPLVHKVGKQMVHKDKQDETMRRLDGAKSAIIADGDQPPEGLTGQRHARVRRKFETSKAKASINALSKGANDGREQEHGHSEDNIEGAARVELHGLEPLPQPSQPEPPTELPSYSTLPRWMATPSRIDSSSTALFKDLNLDTRLLSNLQERGIVKAFAVQAAVFPLLTKGMSRHRGDLCISATTGSGKTLAYMLPMIQALKDCASTKLRGLIVVPTRELVTQAQEVCEVCTAGTGLRIATALGSRALKDEQNVLVESHSVYDPEQYKRERQRPIDWTNFGLEDVLGQSNEAAQATNYVRKFTSKVDMLITTPGRLVDHIRSTPGFTLEDVQWVVIDEADRLLNESFQEWVEVVMPALNSRTATRLRDELLREMRLEVPDRKVQKIILSATMTQDISKLNSLDLRNPRLVVVGDPPHPWTTSVQGGALVAEERLPDDKGIIHLPPTLSEFAVSVGDGSEKPLYLLELLNSQILERPRRQNGLQTSSGKPPSSNTGMGVPDSSSRESDETSSSALSDTSESDSSSDDSDSNSSSTNTLPLTNDVQETALIFTRSTEAATRLSRLLSILSPFLAPSLGTLTKSTNTSSSRKTLSQFRQGKISLLIATDRASRGLDLPGLGHVVSYDVPTSVTTYIHRVGRTARAGKEGKAWTLLSHREARWFWNEIGKARQDALSGEVRIGREEKKVKRVNIDIGKDDDLKGRYDNALRLLGDEVRGNAQCVG